MKIVAAIKKLRRMISVMADLPERMEDLQQAIARIELRQLESNKSSNLHDHEFKAYSQNGEDGILQFLLKHVPIEKKQFVEFGVHDYMESNTRFLLKHNNWEGLVIDGNPANVALMKSDQIYWRHRLNAVASFVTKENINDLIASNNVRGDIGILSVDIDGNDYWVWEVIDCVNPRIVICEYNGLFGPNAPVSTPYDAGFVFSKAHYSTLYCGASIAAFHHLAVKKGYSLVGSNSVGNNIFFVRNDLMGELRALSPAEAYVPYSFRTSRDPAGNLTFLNAEQSVELIEDLPLVDVISGKTVTLRSWAHERALNPAMC